MRYAFIADIHGNFDALSAVLDDIRSERVDQAFCLGDIVGYGAQPGECIAALRENSVLSIAGNHDCAVCGLLSTQYFNPIACASVEWTRETLSKADMDFLSHLPLEFKNKVFILTHGSPVVPGAFEYTLAIQDVIRGFENVDQAFSFQGHSHVAKAWVLNNGSPSCVLERSFVVEEGCRAMINIGSVGQPRDGVSSACYAVFDEDARCVSIRRVPYDTARAAQKILDAGLPHASAYRLFVGA